MPDGKENAIETIKSEFCLKLRELRQERQLSQKAVAEKLNIATSTYANWEQGRTEPGIYDIVNLLNVFEIDANELFSFLD